MLTVLEIIRRTSEFLGKRGVENPRLNAELLVGHVLALPRMQLYLQFERPLTEPELARLRPLVRRRGEREPLQYIVGEVEFCGLKLKVDRRALIPRPETEMLVEIIRELGGEAPAKILDLGTGCGAIALALAGMHPSAQIVAVDRSLDALALAEENAASAGLAKQVRFLESDWFLSLAPDERYDVIVANPPYLSSLETEESEPEVREHEPRTALTPGPSGLEALEAIVREARDRLNQPGLLACETGVGQHVQLAEIARAAGYTRWMSRADMTGRERFFLALV